MKRLLMFSFLVFFWACKNDTSIQKEEENSDKENITDVIPEQLVFTIDFETSNPEVFRLFSNDVFLNNSQFMNIGISHRLNINETSKKIVLKFPEGIKPDYNLYFSFGTKYEKTVILKEIEITYGNKTLTIKPEDLLEYFFFNKFASYDIETRTVTTKKVNGQHNPLIWLKRKYLNELFGE